MKIEEIPRIDSAYLPTPLEYCKNISSLFGECKIWMKRDDLTGHCFGGNKERKLEFILADAVRKKADTVVTIGSMQSNHCRVTAAMAVRLKMDVDLILTADSGEVPAPPECNHYLELLMGARIHIVPSKDTHDKIVSVIAGLRERGKNPYFIEGGGHNELGAVSYALALKEIKEQSEKAGFKPDYIFLPTGTGTTQAGLILGKDIFGLDSKIVGISIARKHQRCLEEIADVLNKTFNMLERDYEIPEITIYEKYKGSGYGILNKEAIEAIKLLSRTEGMILDPIYNGKAFAGLLDRVKKKKIRGNIVYINTGGTPGIFSQYARKEISNTI